MLICLESYKRQFPCHIVSICHIWPLEGWTLNSLLLEYVLKYVQLYQFAFYLNVFLCLLPLDL